MHERLRASRLGVLFVLTLAVQSLFAQQSSSSSSSTSDSGSERIPRVWFGAVGSYTPLKQVKATSYSNTTTLEQLSSAAANGQIGGGLTFNVHLFDGYWFNLDGVYRFAGFDTNDTVNNAAGDYYAYRTRARYFDFPLVLRYAGPKYRWSKYAFYELGGTLRHVYEHTTSAAVNSSGPFCCAPPQVVAFHSNVEGLVVGTGLIGRDPFGIVVSPEVRYTRWLGNTFHSPSVTGQDNQLEVTISFGF